MSKADRDQLVSIIFTITIEDFNLITDLQYYIDSEQHPKTKSLKLKYYTKYLHYLKTEAIIRLDRQINFLTE